MDRRIKYAALALGALLIVLCTAVTSASAVLLVTGRLRFQFVGASATAMATATTTPTATIIPSPTATPHHKPTPTATPVPPPPAPTATPLPVTHLIFDCATATTIDRVSRSYSLDLCLRTSPARPYYNASYSISWCGKPPSSATESATTHLDYAGKQTADGVTVNVSCDPPLTIVLTAYSIEPNTGGGGPYPLVGSASIYISH